MDADRLEFAPPPQPDLLRALVLAVIAHVLLMIALTWGIKWNRDAENVAVEAELWSSVPREAAPKLVEAPPPPPVEKKVEVAPPPPPPVVKEADIALEREKKKQELAKQRAEELERQKKLEAKKKLEEQKREQLAEKKAAEERKKKEEQLKLAKTKKQQLEDDKKLAALRAEQMRRIQGLAGATGGEQSKGTALRSSGPSTTYASRIAARIKPNIVFTDVVAGNPAAEVEIRVAPDGTIVGSKLVESSGNKAWDEAVLRAIDRTGSIPRDTDGTVVPRFPIRFRPKD